MERGQFVVFLFLVANKSKKKEKKNWTGKVWWSLVTIVVIRRHNQYSVVVFKESYSPSSGRVSQTVPQQKCKLNCP